MGMSEKDTIDWPEFKGPFVPRLMSIDGPSGTRVATAEFDKDGKLLKNGDTVTVEMPVSITLD